MGAEELYIKKIEAGIRAIKLDTKSPAEAGVGSCMNKLKEVNLPMYEELIETYKKAVIEWNKRHPTKEGLV